MNDLQKVRSVFCEALERQTQEDREAYLTEACRDDSELRAEVDALLNVQPEADEFFRSPLIGAQIPDSHISETPGETIGRYKLLEKIGEGGMAVVYMAEQREPIRRKVALKIIKLGMDTKSVIARFEAERQALAVMDHPNIAKVLDAGATDTGRPYFVMELVKGTSITEFCDVNNLSTHERLELFICVCQAVQHAHQKGIIHRDIKPSNIMVTLHDGKPVPKVIDFGIAKAVNRQLTDKTFFTRYAQIIGTPAYMSPEQAEMSGLDIDIRTDVFSLGTLLYELLTGSTPFDTKYLLGKSYEQMQRTIREEEPMRPSTKISTLGEALVEVAKRRRTSPDALRKLIRADLDWVVMKTLEKDRDRRYDTVSEFAADIRRYLKREPVLAGPPSVTYRIKKFIKRHSISVAVSTAIAATIILGLVISTALYLRMREALNTVHQLETKADMDSKLSTAQRLHADGRHQAALNELEAVFDKQAPEPEAQLLRAQLLAEVGRLEDAETQLLLLTKAGSEVAGAAYSLLARLSIGVDDTKANEYRVHAESMLPETAEAYCLRAMTAPDSEQALQWLDRAVALNPSHYPSRKARVLMRYARGEYQAMVEDVAAIIALRPEDYLGYSIRAIMRRDSDRFEEALADHARAIELCESTVELTEAYAQRHITHEAMGDYKGALHDARRVAELEPGNFSYRMRVFTSLAALEDFNGARLEYRSIIQTSHQWDRSFTRYAPWYVFTSSGAGANFTVPADVVQRAPFAQMESQSQCYHFLDSQATHLETRRRGVVAYAWSPDGKELLCGFGRSYGSMERSVRQIVSTNPATSGLKIINIESGEERLVARSFGGRPAWSPDGKYIAYPDSDDNLYIFPADGGQSRKLAIGSWPQWSQDSQRLYFWSGWPEAQVCSININDPEPVPQNLTGRPGAFVVSEAEGWIAYATPTGLRMVDISSGALLYEWSCPWPEPVLLNSLSTDSRELCVRTSSYSHINVGPLVLDTRDKDLYEVLEFPVDAILRSPDGSRLAIGACRGVWIMQIDPGLSVSEALGRIVHENDCATHEIEKLTGAIEADPMYPENYLRRALALLSIDEHEQAESDMRQLEALVTGNDHHVGYEMFWWLSQYYSNQLYEEAEFLRPHAEKLMQRFPSDVPSYRELIIKIIDQNEGNGMSELAQRWRTRLQELDAR